jgi:autotransporter-associated beta strand protein
VTVDFTSAALNFQPNISGASISVGNISFLPGATTFTVYSDTSGMTPGNLDLYGSGISNNSGSPQTFVVGGSGGQNSFISFYNSSSAGNALFYPGALGAVNFYNSSSAAQAGFIVTGGGVNFYDSSSAAQAAFSFFNPGSVNFYNSSSAAQATFTVNNGTFGSTGGLNFYDSSSAAQATIVANNGTVQFYNNSSAGSAQITNATSNITASAAGVTIFNDASTAGSATIVNTGAPSIVATGTNSSGLVIDLRTGSIVNPGFTFFLNTSSAGHANITNINGGFTGFSFTASAGSAHIINGSGGETVFFDSSSAGSANIINNAGGQLVFASTSTATNATTVTNNAGGFLDIGTLTNGGITIGQVTGAGNIYLGANNLTIGGQNASGTISGVISDGVSPGNNFQLPASLVGGSLTKIGNGSLDLTGANTYTGNTMVSGGSLFVDGSIVSPLTTVNMGALLGGHGIIGGNVINNGVVSPGNSPGTLTVKGNYTQASSGTLLIEVGGLAASQHDLLKVGGSASLAGALQLQPLNGFKFSDAGQTVTFLTAAAGETGRFSSVQNLSSFNGPITNTTLIYLPDAVELEAKQGSVFSALHGLPGLTGNDLQTAKLLDSAAHAPAAAKLFSVLDGATVSQLIKDIQLIDPGQLAALSNIGSSISNQTILSLTQRFETIQGLPTTQGPGGPAGPDGKGGKEVLPPAADNRWGSFITGSGDFERVEDTSASRGFNFGSGGVTLGVDYRFTDHFAAGLFTSYTNTGIDIANGGRINVNVGKWGLYGTYFNGGFYVNSAAEGGYSAYDNHRDALGGTARSSTEGGDFSALFAPGYNWTMGGLTFGPTSRFQYSYQGTDGFTESGSFAPMAVASQHTESIVSAIGMKASYDWKIRNIIIRPELRLEWEHEYSDTTTGIDAQLASGAGHAVALTTPTIGRDDLHLGAGCAVVVSERITAYFYYDGQFFRTNYDSSTITGGLRVSF